MITDLGRDLECAGQGQQLANRLKAQAMDSSTNFYARTHNKKVSLLASVEPLMLYGMWVPDLIRLASCHPQFSASKQFLVPTDWKEILAFKPDVIVVAPHDGDLKSALALFKKMERFPNWENIPAVKRGEVIFTGGEGVF